MDFGQALKALKQGAKIARTGWNGEAMWLSLSGPLEGREIPGFAKVLPCITMKTADGSILMGWLASQPDMLSEDWFLVGEEPDDLPTIAPGFTRYRSHKVVEAARIVGAEFNADGSGKVAISARESDPNIIPVPPGFQRNPGDVLAAVEGAGAVLMRYPDGYLSWSPMAPFLDGYRNA